MISLIFLVLTIIVPSFTNGCGMRPAFSRVVNGQDASPHSWPWQISLRVRGGHICGGSLIRADWVLTAAHCVYRNPNPSGYTVVVGAHWRTGSTSVQQTFQVKTLHKHSGFTMRNLKHDVAVLQLERPVQLSDKVTTICLPDKDADLNSKCYITGWGRISGGGPAADILQQAELPLVSHSDCRNKYGSTIDRSAHLCAGEGRSAASGGCNGDSGGPLACEMGGRWYLHGAVSFGMRNCPTTYFTVFARITSHKSWILQKIGNDGGPKPPPPPCTSAPPSPPTQTGCGKRPAFARVVNGQNASSHSWPWQISLRVRGGHICGGSLIRPDWVVTAAHCVYRNPNPSGYTVVVGGHRRTGTTSVQQTFRVKTLYKHDGFTMQNLKHDVAVLQLERPVQISDKVTTICLPDGNADLSLKCYITGWGRISGGGPAADILQQAKLPLVSHSNCRRRYGSTIDMSAHLCAGEGRSSASGGCNGDSGGPLACEKGGRWYLHGAVSFGMRNCPTTHYTVFARIFSYKSWILRKIGQ